MGRELSASMINASLKPSTSTAPLLAQGRVRANIFVKAFGNWVFTIAPLLNVEHIRGESDKLKLYERPLMDTYYLNEVTYGLTRNGDMVVHAETHKDVLTPENFEVEFYSVVYGTEYFI